MRRQLAALPMAAVAAVWALGGVTPVAAETTVSSSAMATWQANGTVLEVTYGGSSVYLVGDFTAVRAPGSGTSWVTRRHAAAFRASDGSLLPWNPDANARVETVTVSPDGNHVFLGGDFTTVRGAARSHLAKVGARYGRLDSWKASTNGTVRTLKPAGSRGVLYVGGSFSTLNGATRKRLGAVRLSSGSLVTGFSAGTSDPAYATVGGVVLTSAGLWVGGHFESIRGRARKNLALLDPATGAVRAPKPSAPIPVLRTVAANGRLCVTGRGHGGFAACFGVASGRKLWGGVRKANGDVQAAALTDGRLYVGGHFDGIWTPTGLRARGHLAAFDPGTGKLLTWNPGADSSVGVVALGRSGDGSRVAAGGAFTHIGGRAQEHFGQFRR